MAIVGVAIVTGVQGGDAALQRRTLYDVAFWDPFHERRTLGEDLLARKEELIP